MSSQPIQLSREVPHQVAAHEEWGIEQAFAEFLREKSPNTAKAYDGDLRLFAKWLGVPSVLEAIAYLFDRPQIEVTRAAVAWRNVMRTEGLSSATRNRRLSAIRAVLHCGRTGGLTANRLEIKGDKGAPRRDTRGPGLEAVVSMLRAAKADARPRVAARDVAIIRCALDLGLRRSEIVSLRIGDVLGDRIRVEGKGRGGERETVSLPAATLEAINAWLRVYPYDKGEDRPLFVGLFAAASGKALHGNGLSAILKRRAEDAGLDPRTIRAHGLRHTALTTAAQATGFNLEAVRAFGRHKSVDTTRRYLDDATDHAGKCANLVADLVKID